MKSAKKIRRKEPVDRYLYFLNALAKTLRVDPKEKVIYLPEGFQITPVDVHDINVMKTEFKFRLQYEIPIPE